MNRRSFFASATGAVLAVCGVKAVKASMIRDVPIRIRIVVFASRSIREYDYEIPIYHERSPYERWLKSHRI